MVKTGVHKKAFFVLVAFVVCSLCCVSVAMGALDPHRFDAQLGTDWYGLYLHGAKVGYVKNSLEKVAGPIDGWRLHSVTTMSVRMAGQENTTVVDDVRLFRSPGGDLCASRLSAVSPTGEITVIGEGRKGRFVVTSNIGGRETQKVFDYPLDRLDDALALDSYISSGKAVVGAKMRVSTFEPTPPLTGILHQDITIRAEERCILNGVPTDVYVVDMFHPELDLKTYAKIDHFGRMLESTLGVGMLIRLEAEDQAKRLDDSFDVLLDGLIRADKTLADPGRLLALKLRVTGLSASDVRETETQNVTAEGEGRLLIEIRSAAPPGEGVRLPIKSKDLLSYLLPGPYEQSDDPEIVALAAKIVGNEQDGWAAAKRINAWVYKNIQKRFTPDFSNALQTLHSGQGDCGEHTALAVALLRAAGLPARSLTGIVYWPPGNGFGYHAWVEVYVGKWVQMDPSWGEDVANPSHVVLAYGGDLKEIGSLCRVIGKAVRIEILAATYGGLHGEP